MDPYTLGRDGLVALLDDLATEPQPAYRAAQVRAWLARGVDDPAAMTDLPAGLRRRLAEVFDEPPRVATRSVADRGLTHKILLTHADGESTESVLMLYPARGGSRPRAGRATVCVSTQAGCAMGCPFCATGQAGFRRQLRAGEILRQVTVAQGLLRRDEIVACATRGAPLGTRVPDHVSNVVFMGMGEPLANLDATLAAVRWLCGPEEPTFGLSARAVTVSTVGLVPGMRRLAALGLPITLAVSLHAPNDALRDDLVPLNRRHPLGELLDACRAWIEVTGRRLSFEYVLIGGINDAPEHAEQLADLVGELRAHVNLIPMNPTPAVPWRAPPPDRMRAFAAVLERSGLAVSLRANRGGEIDAACGQLYANYALTSGRVMPLARGAAARLQAARTGPQPAREQR